LDHEQQITIRTVMRSLATMLVVTLFWPATAASQSDQDLLRRIEALERTLEQQAREIDELKRQLAQAPTPTAEAKTPPPPEASSAAADRVEQRTAELPPDQIVSEFPGSFPIPGSDAALKIGGLVRVNWVSTSDALLVDDRFVTSAIPVAGSPDASKGSRVTVIARPSRFNFDLRTPTGVGHMRAFIEADFAGSNNTLRLRHAYGQWKRAIFGQTWSTFSDPEAEPDGIDFEGLNAIILFRQAQVRWSFAPSERIRLALAFEDPRPDLTGAQGVNQVPDIIARARWQPARGGHLQTAVLLRQIRGTPEDQPNEVVGDFGWGATFSGRLPSPIFSTRDQVMFQLNSGAGIGRYVSDLSAEGGQDGVYDPVLNELTALRAHSGYVGYEHWWTERLRSAISFGVVGVDNLDIQTDDALHITRRYSGNFIWSPIPRLDLVTEFLWGVRINRDGRRGRASQTQIGATFRF
jgi:DcaP outer membrane protein